MYKYSHSDIQNKYWVEPHNLHSVFQHILKVTVIQKRHLDNIAYIPSGLNVNLLIQISANNLWSYSFHDIILQWKV